jgi:Tetratricopeptide repeat
MRASGVETAEVPAAAAAGVMRIAGLESRDEQLVIAISVYREPADRNAIVFQLGQHDWTAARAPDRQGPAPPYQAPPDLTAMIASCVRAEVLSPRKSSDALSAADCWFVDPWLAGALHQQLATAGRQAEVVTAHRRAAGYWQWRAAAWPQGRRHDLHDLLEARFHLFSAGDAEQASEITRAVCAQLHAWGDLGREAELIQATLDLLPGGSATWAGWMHDLGAICQLRGDHESARTCYTASVDVYAILGEYGEVARGQHSLGVLAQAEGDYRRAERHYRRSSAAEQKASSIEPVAPDLEAGGQEPADQHAATGPAGVTPGPGLTAVPDAALAIASTASATAAIMASSHAAASQKTVQSRATRRPRPATGRPALRLVETGEAAAPPDLPLAAALHKPAAPELAPVAVPSPVTRVAAPAAETTAEFDSPAAGKPARPGRRKTAVVLLAGLIACALAFLGLLLYRQSIQIRAGASPATPSASAVRLAAASWVAGQVSKSAIVGCDPAMCAALRQHGLPAGDLLGLGPGGAADPLASNVVIATAAVRIEFGTRLTDVYAPQVLASIGRGTAAIQIRTVAPDGASAFLAAARADLLARRRFGASLLHNPHLLVAGPARRQLLEGLVDSRLLIVLATIADTGPVRVAEFGDAGPGADHSVPLRLAVLTPAGGSNAGWARTILTFLAAQQAPFRPESARQASLPGTPLAVRIEYSAPAPLGLLTSPGTPPAASVHH